MTQLSVPATVEIKVRRWALGEIEVGDVRHHVCLYGSYRYLRSWLVIVPLEGVRLDRNGQVEAVTFNGRLYAPIHRTDVYDGQWRVVRLDDEFAHFERVE